MKELRNLIGCPKNGISIGRAIENTPIAQRIPCGAGQFGIGTIEKDQRDFKVEKWATGSDQIGLEQITVSQFHGTPTAFVIHHPERDEKHDVSRSEKPVA